MPMGIRMTEANPQTKQHPGTFHEGQAALTKANFMGIIPFADLESIFHSAHSCFELEFNQEKKTAVLIPRFINAIEVDGKSILSDELIIIHAGKTRKLKLGKHTFFVCVFSNI